MFASTFFTFFGFQAATLKRDCVSLIMSENRLLQIYGTLTFMYSCMT